MYGSLITIRNLNMLKGKTYRKVTYMKKSTTIIVNFNLRRYKKLYIFNFVFLVTNLIHKIVIRS